MTFRRAFPHNLISSLSFGPRAGMTFGLLFYGFEAVQSIALIPFFNHILGAGQASTWVLFTTSLALISVSISGYYQPLIRSISAALNASNPVPCNWSVINRGIAFIGLSILLLGQLVFSLVICSSTKLVGHEAVGALLIYFLAQQLRLLAFNNFILWNGLRLVGKDKLYLLFASGLSISLTVTFGLLFGTLLSLAIASLLANAALYLSTRHASAERFSGSGLSNNSIVPPSPKEISGLVLLNIGGYLNLSTDIVVGALSLSDAAMLEYAFWSRLLTSQLAFAGLWAQVKFPYWSSRNIALREALKQLLTPLPYLVVFSLLCLAAYHISARLGFDLVAPSTPLWVFPAMVANSACACVSVLVGQMLTARRIYLFVKPSIVISAFSPVLAVSLGSFGGAFSFVSGFLIANFLLLVLHCWIALRCLRGHTWQASH